MDLAQKKLYCEVVAALLIADAAVTDEERAFLERLMDRFGLDTPAKQGVINSVNFGESVADRVRQLSPEIRPALLEELRVASTVDGDIGPREARLLEQVERLLQDG